MSWLLVICKKCAGKLFFFLFIQYFFSSSSSTAVHQILTSEFLHLQSLLTISCDPDLIDLLHDYGNEYSNKLLGDDLFENFKPNYYSTQIEREQYIKKKYLEKIHLAKQNNYSQEQLNQLLYENVETNNYGKTLHLIMLGANTNYSQKMFSIADHAKRYQQIKQMKIILANGGKFCISDI
jgi:hypothetical protein